MILVIPGGLDGTGHALDTYPSHVIPTAGCGLAFYYTHTSLILLLLLHTLATFAYVLSYDIVLQCRH